MIFYVNNSKDYTHTQNRTIRINKFSQVAKHKKQNKNKFLFYTLSMKNQKRKLRKNYIYNSYRKNKILRNKPNQEDERLIHNIL